MNRTFHLISFIVILTTVVMFSSQAFGYVLSGSQILEHTVRKLGKAKNVRIKQKLILYDEKLDGGVLELNETVTYLFPELFRSTITSDDTKKIHVASFEQALIVLDGKVASEFESGFDHYKDLLAFKNRMTLQKRLQLLGLDTGETRLERYNDKVVFVIGRQESYGETYPELYVDQKTFLPVKWLLRGSTLFGEKAEPLEVVFYNWKKFKRIMFPKKIEFYRNQVLVREIRMEKIKVNAKINENIFNFDALKTKYSKPEPVNEQPEKKDEKSAARKTIDGLDKIIENDQLAY